MHKKTHRQHGLCGVLFYLKGICFVVRAGCTRGVLFVCYFPAMERYKQKPAHATARVDNRNSKPTKTARRASKPPEEALARQGKKGLAFLPCKCYNIHCKDRLLSILFAGVMT